MFKEVSSNQLQEAALSQYPDVNPNYWYNETVMFRIIAALLAEKGLKMSEHGMILNQNDSLHTFAGKTFSVACAQVIGESKFGEECNLKKLATTIENILAISTDKAYHNLIFPLNKGKRHWSMLVLKFSVINQHGKNHISQVHELGEHDLSGLFLNIEKIKSMLCPILRKYQAKAQFPYNLFGSGFSYPVYSYFNRRQISNACGVHVVDFILETISAGKVAVTEEKYFTLAEELASRDRHLQIVNDQEFTSLQKADDIKVVLAKKDTDSVQDTVIFQDLYAYITGLPLQQRGEFYNSAHAFYIADLKLERDSSDDHVKKAKLNLQIMRAIGVDAAEATETDEDVYLKTSILKIWFREHYNDLLKQGILINFFKPELKDDQLEWQTATDTVRDGKDVLITILDRYFMVVRKHPVPPAPGLTGFVL